MSLIGLLVKWRARVSALPAMIGCGFLCISVIYPASAQTKVDETPLIAYCKKIYQQGVAQEQQGHLQQAYVLYVQAQEFADLPIAERATTRLEKQWHKQAASAVARARTAAQHGHWKRALGLLQTAVNEQPGNPIWRRDLAAALDQMGHVNQAAAELRLEQNLLSGPAQQVVAERREAFLSATRTHLHGELAYCAASLNRQAPRLAAAIPEPEAAPKKKVSGGVDAFNEDDPYANEQPQLQCAGPDKTNPRFGHQVKLRNGGGKAQLPATPLAMGEAALRRYCRRLRRFRTALLASAPHSSTVLPLELNLARCQSDEGDVTGAVTILADIQKRAAPLFLANSPVALRLQHLRWLVNQHSSGNRPQANGPANSSLTTAVTAAQRDEDLGSFQAALRQWSAAVSEAQPGAPLRHWLQQRVRQMRLDLAVTPRDTALQVAYEKEVNAARANLLPLFALSLEVPGVLPPAVANHPELPPLQCLKFDQITKLTASFVNYQLALARTHLRRAAQIDPLGGRLNQLMLMIDFQTGDSSRTLADANVVRARHLPVVLYGFARQYGHQQVKPYKMAIEPGEVVLTPLIASCSSGVPQALPAPPGSDHLDGMVGPVRPSVSDVHIGPILSARVSHGLVRIRTRQEQWSFWPDYLQRSSILTSTQLRSSLNQLVEVLVRNCGVSSFQLGDEKLTTMEGLNIGVAAVGAAAIPGAWNLVALVPQIAVSAHDLMLQNATSRAEQRLQEPQLDQQPFVPIPLHPVRWHFPG